ncbi:MAG: helix-turn-helix transcriptional regulator [Dehalococcoidia bacterium]
MAMRRDDGLTRRERDVLSGAASGLTNESIALQLGISRNAVRFHLKQSTPSSGRAANARGY